MKLTFFKGVVLGVTTCFVMLAGASALAGTGVGDVFNLGQNNTVDATSTLVGTTNGGPQLQVTNQGAGAAVRGDGTAGRGVVGSHDNATGPSPGVEGSTSSTDNNAAGVVGIVSPAGAPIGSAGVRGINSGAGAGVAASSAHGDGLQATSQALDRAGIRALHTGNDDGYALFAESNPSAWAGWFGGRVHVNDDTEIYGKLDVHGNLTVTGSSPYQNRCANGAVLASTLIQPISSFPSTYSTVNGFNCTGLTVQARRASSGIYFVRFNGICCQLQGARPFHAVVGNVYNSGQDDFTVIDFRTDPLDNMPAFRVSIRDANGGNEDLAFTVIVV